MESSIPDKKEPTPKTDDVIRSMGGDLSEREQHIADWARCLERAAPSTVDAPTAAEQELANIANAKRFDRKIFENDTSFADWAQSRCRHTLAHSSAIAPQFDVECARAAAESIIETYAKSYDRMELVSRSRRGFRPSEERKAVPLQASNYGIDRR